MNERFLNNHTPDHIKKYSINKIIKENTKNQIKKIYESLVNRESDCKIK